MESWSIFPFCVWLIFLTVMFSRFIHFTEYQDSIFSYSWIIFHCMPATFKFFHLLLDTWIISTFWLLWIILLCTRVYKCLESLLSIPLGIYLGVGFLIMSNKNFYLACHISDVLVDVKGQIYEIVLTMKNLSSEENAYTWIRWGKTNFYLNLKSVQKKTLKG